MAGGIVMSCLDLLNQSPTPPTIQEIRGPGRNAELVQYRHFLAYELRKKGLSLNQVGAALNRDRGAIVHAQSTVSERLETDKKYREWHEKMLDLTENA